MARLTHSGHRTSSRYTSFDQPRRLSIVWIRQLHCRIRSRGGYEATRVHRSGWWRGSMAARGAGAAIKTHPGRRRILGLCRCRGSGCEPKLPLLKGLAELGYVPGKTFILEERYANEIPERFDTLAAELVDLKVDVLVSQAGGTNVCASSSNFDNPNCFCWRRRPSSCRFRVEPFQAGRKYERHISNVR